MLIRLWTNLGWALTELCMQDHPRCSPLLQMIGSDPRTFLLLLKSCVLSALLYVPSLCKFHSKEAGEIEPCWSQADFKWCLFAAFLLPCRALVLHLPSMWCSMLKPWRVSLYRHTTCTCWSWIQQSRVLFLGEYTDHWRYNLSHMETVQHRQQQNKSNYVSAWARKDVSMGKLCNSGLCSLVCRFPDKNEVATHQKINPVFLRKINHGRFNCQNELFCGSNQ